MSTCLEKHFLVAPVTEPRCKSEWNVYLAQIGLTWYDFWTGKALSKGGQTIKTGAPLDKIPLVC